MKPVAEKSAGSSSSNSVGHAEHARALQPPPYGLEFVDREIIQRMPQASTGAAVIQRQPSGKLPWSRVDVTFNAWYAKMKNVDRALAQTKAQIGGPYPADYVPPPRRRADQLKKLDPNTAEVAVGGRADENQAIDLSERSQVERIANLVRLTQIDADPKSETDTRSCGAHSVIAGIYHSDPQQIALIAQQMKAKYEKGAIDTLATSSGMQPAEAFAALDAIESGKASPVQIARLSQLLTLRAKMVGEISGPGVNADMVKHLTQDVLTKEFGVKVPPMELRLLAQDGENHWVAHFPTASQASTVQDAPIDHYVTFDGWPRQDGLASTSATTTKRDADVALAQQPGVVVQQRIHIDAGGAAVIDPFDEKGVSDLR
jgi:hypothetical protein